MTSAATRYLRGRNWRGAIKIDQERQTLTIQAQPPGTSRAETDLKLLSGGERSYVTVCYLLALCKKLQGSFHCLDEFDVFMDNINRGVSLAVSTQKPLKVAAESFRRTGNAVLGSLLDVQSSLTLRHHS